MFIGTTSAPPAETTGCGVIPRIRTRDFAEALESWRRICDILHLVRDSRPKRRELGRALPEQRAPDQRLRHLELRLGVLDLDGELRRLRPLRRDDDEPADEHDEEEPDRRDPDGCASVQALDHRRPPVGLRVAAIVNLTGVSASPPPRTL